jgi:hypothetical protein
LGPITSSLVRTAGELALKKGIDVSVRDLLSKYPNPNPNPNLNKTIYETHSYHPQYNAVCFLRSADCRKDEEQAYNSAAEVGFPKFRKSKPSTERVEDVAFCQPQPPTEGWISKT